MNRVLERMSPLEHVVRERRGLADRMRRAWGATTGALRAVTEAIGKTRTRRGQRRPPGRGGHDRGDRRARELARTLAQRAATLALFIARRALPPAQRRENEAKRRSDAAGSKLCGCGTPSFRCNAVGG